MEKPAITSQPIHDLLQRRWSPRAFSDQLIDDETLTKLFEAARWTPSWRNDQPWRFIVATRNNEEEFQQMFDCVMPGNQTWAGKAAALVAIATRERYRDDDPPNPITFYDGGQAAANLTLEAMNHDLYCHQMGGINRDKVRETYDVPEDYNPIVIIAIGYMGNADDLPDGVRERELGERSRKPLTDIVFRGSWGSSADLG